MSSRPTQLNLLPKEHRGRSEHGGTTRKGLRKDRRPFAVGRPIHLVLKSSRARGGLSMLHRKHRSKVDQLVYGWAAKAGVKLYRYENVGTHLHLLIKALDQHSFKRFLRTVSGLVARSVTGARKGHKGGRFWDAPVFSRVLHWGREFAALKAYLAKNRLEAWGFLGARLRIREGQHLIVVGDESLLKMKP
jgi:hypothetical protein